MTAFYYLLFVAIGAILAHRYGKNTKEFLWKEYWALLAAPLLGVAAITMKFGFAPLKSFILGMIFLPTLEWFTGLAYHKVLGARLWEYHRYPLPGKYTSWLTLPIWGAGAVLLWLISNNL